MLYAIDDVDRDGEQRPRMAGTGSHDSWSMGRFFQFQQFPLDAFDSGLDQGVTPFGVIRTDEENEQR